MEEAENDIDLLEAKLERVSEPFQFMRDRVWMACSIEHKKGRVKRACECIVEAIIW